MFLYSIAMGFQPRNRVSSIILGINTEILPRNPVSKAKGQSKYILPF